MKEGKLLESPPQRQMPFQSFQQKNCFTPLPSPSKRRKTGTTLVILIQFNFTTRQYPTSENLLSSRHNFLINKRE